MNDFIDIYCERTAQGFWDEPFNALSNAAFFIAAFFVFRLARRAGAQGWESGLLVFLMVAIGLGSLAFHTLATGWAQLADVLPILFFQIAFIFIYAWQVMDLGRGKACILIAVFFALSFIFDTLPREWLNGSLSYGPAMLFLLGLGSFHYSAEKSARLGLMAAALVFTVSLTLRSIDMAVCDTLPAGVHYFWHMLNAVVLYLAARALLLNRPARS